VSDVRRREDHINLSKIDHGYPQWRWQAMQQQRCPEIDFREIFCVIRFSSFATQSGAKQTSRRKAATF
jgi:hypothetical protein